MLTLKVAVWVGNRGNNEVEVVTSAATLTTFPVISTVFLLVAS